MFHLQDLFGSGRGPKPQPPLKVAKVGMKNFFVAREFLEMKMYPMLIKCEPCSGFGLGLDLEFGNPKG